MLSAYPLVAKHQVEWKKIKMAMSLKGKNTHYYWDTIQVRHWLTMAEKCQFSPIIMQEIIDEVCDTMEDVISQISQSLPLDFPAFIADPIFSGMRQVKNRCR